MYGYQSRLSGWLASSKASPPPRLVSLHNASLRHKSHAAQVHAVLKPPCRSRPCCGKSLRSAHPCSTAFIGPRCVPFRRSGSQSCLRPGRSRSGRAICSCATSERAPPWWWWWRLSIALLSVVAEVLSSRAAAMAMPSFCLGIHLHSAQEFPPNVFGIIPL